MKKILVQTTAALAFLGTLAACNAKISSDDMVPTATDKPFANEVQGPNLEGTWKSGCEHDYWSNGYVVFDISVTKQNIVRTETKYSDVSCSLRTSQTVRDGQFRFVKNYGADIFEVEYKFKMGNGFYYTGDNLRRVGAKLYISDRRVGNAVVPDIPLNLQLN